MIEVRAISKSFKIPVRNAGIFSAVKSFFHREYKTIEALKSIDFSIEKGEIVGYIGPNGAGKSSTIKIMSGILRPDSGVCKVDELNPFTDRKRHAKNIGVVFGQRSQLWWDIPVIDSFELLKDMYRIPEEEYSERLEELVSLLDIKDIVRMPTRQLSLGQKMRCEICASLLHNPKVLFLDEPTIGLDAVSKLAVRKIIKDINQKYQTTVVLTTHDMQDIESLASRIILIGDGRIVFDGTMREFKERFTMKRYLEVIFEGELPSNLSYSLISKSSDRFTMELNKPLSQVILELSQHISIQDVKIIEESIDDMLIHVYQEMSL